MVFFALNDPYCIYLTVIDDTNPETEEYELGLCASQPVKHKFGLVHSIHLTTGLTQHLDKEITLSTYNIYYDLASS